MPWTSTLGHPLSADEEDRIAGAWHDLCEQGWGLSMATEPVEMLNQVTDLIMKSWEVRRAISDAWFYANKRAAPVRLHMTKAKLDKMLLMGKEADELRKALECLTDDDVQKVLDVFNKGVTRD